ncbi:MAG: trypsin-like peptidase domain-containing protein [Deltaproteobacteria bacterium]|nr:trypsin-like peptidase domain-containing protein [Deltaproteobacteria bacterium]
MKVNIIHLFGSAVGKTQTIEGDRVRLGTGADNEVVFDSKKDPTVAAEHAEIVREGDRWVFHDKVDANLSLIGGRPIDEMVLVGGEEIEIGRGGPLIRVVFGELKQAEPEPVKAPGPKTMAFAVRSARKNTSRLYVVIGVVALALVAVAVLVWRLLATETKVDEIALSKLGPSELGEAIARQNSKKIYLLLVRDAEGKEQGFCTGFAIAPSSLLTNAHCVADIQSLAPTGATFYAALNEGSGARYPVTSWAAHPGYDHQSPRPTADLGLIGIDGKMTELVTLARPDQLGSVAAGMQIFVFGFPGDLNNVRSPVATLTQGVVGRLTTFSGKAADKSSQHLLQYSAFTTKGTSGSPVFDKHGRVVAVNSGYYKGRSMMRIEDPLTGETEEAKVSRDLSGYSFGVRIDLAAPLLGN